MFPSTRAFRPSCSVRRFHSSLPLLSNDPTHDLQKVKGPKLTSQNHRFPDWVEKWNRRTFFGAGATLTGGTVALWLHLPPHAWTPYLCGAFVTMYWLMGYKDLNQNSHALAFNFPVLGHVRYFFESLRPEIRQYFIESDTESIPFSRESRSIVYQRAKSETDTQPLGTRMNVYGEGYEWANHSICP
jgi:hypothetical protein